MAIERFHPEDDFQGANIDPQHGYDAEVLHVHGQVIYEHRSHLSMTAALSQEEVESRVFSFTQPASFGGYSQRIGFINTDGTLHNLTHDIDTREELDAIDEGFSAPITERKLAEADGRIIVDGENGDVYRMYSTDTPGKPDRAELQVQTWIADVREAAARQPEAGIIQFLREDDVTAVDYTVGKTHLVTELDHEEGHTLDYIAADLPLIPKRDNGPILRWNAMIRE